MKAKILTCCPAVSQVKNVSGDMLDGKVGRIYMPKQDLEGLALRKMKVRTSFLSAPMYSFETRKIGESG